MKPETRGTFILFFSLFLTDLLIALSIYKLRLDWTRIPGWIVQNAVWLGFGGAILFLLTISVQALDPTRLERPFSGVPWDGRWWEFVVSGAFFGVMLPVYTLLFMCVAVILPVIVPFKLLRFDVLGPQATLYSAFLSFPVLFLTVSLAFTIMYIF